MKIQHCKLPTSCNRITETDFAGPCNIGVKSILTVEEIIIKQVMYYIATIFSGTLLYDSCPFMPNETIMLSYEVLHLAMV